MSKFRSAHFEIQINHFTAWSNSPDAAEDWFVTAEETLGWICQVPLRSDCDYRIVYSSASVGLTQKLNRTRLYIYVMYQLLQQMSRFARSSILSPHKVNPKQLTNKKKKLIRPANFSVSLVRFLRVFPCQTDTFFSYQPQQYPREPEYVSLKIRRVISSETSEYWSATRRSNPKEENQLNVCVCVCVCVCAPARVRGRTYECMYVCVCACVGMYVCTHVCMYVCMYICI